MAFCTECGAELEKGAKFCPGCGARVQSARRVGKARGAPSRARARAAPRRREVAAETPPEPEVEIAVPPARPEELEPQPPTAPEAHVEKRRGGSTAVRAAKAAVMAVVTIFLVLMIIGFAIEYGQGNGTTTWTSTSSTTTSTHSTIHTTTQPPVGGFYDIHQEWSYGGGNWTYDDQIPVATYQYFKDKPRSSDYGEYVDNPDDDAYMEGLAKQLEDAAAAEGWEAFDTVSFTLAFVQSWPYTSDSVTTPYDEYPRYPLETIVDGGGDCEDTSILFCSIVRGMGYGTVLLHLEADRHMAAGVKVSQELVDTWNQPYSLTYYNYGGDLYAFCETTGDGWELGHMPESWVSESAIVIVV